MSYDDFCRLTPPELEAALKAWREEREAAMRDRWERMRLHAVMTMQPHCRKRLSPYAVLPLPWEKKPRKAEGSALLSKEEQKARFLKKSGLA